MKIYKEDELLTVVQHPGALDPNLKEEFIGEKKEGCLHFGGKVFSNVINSAPMYCRMEDEHTDGEQWVTYRVNKDSSIIKNNIYETICPKVAWGFSAYLISVCRGIININGKQCINVSIVEAYNSYYNNCLSFFKDGHKDNILYYSDNGMEDKIKSLIDNFTTEHLENERALLEKTINAKSPLLDIGNFFDIAEGYFSFVENNNYGRISSKKHEKNSDEQNILDWIIGDNEEEKGQILNDLKKEIGENKPSIACPIIKRYCDSGKIHKPTYKQIIRHFPKIGAESGYYKQLATAFDEKPRVKYRLD